MSVDPTYGTCEVCESARCEVDEGGFLFCPSCGAREEPNGVFLPMRVVDSDYQSFSRSLEPCPRCGEHETSRDSDDYLYCFACERAVHAPVPESWYPAGAVCKLAFRCIIPA